MPEILRGGGYYAFLFSTGRRGPLLLLMWFQSWLLFNGRFSGEKNWVTRWLEREKRFFPAEREANKGI